MKKLSIILQTYNRPFFLKQAIDGILNQTFIDFELIIFDNGSELETTLLINSYSDKRISHVRNDVNSREFINDIFKIQLCEYFIITHDDDIMEPDFISSEINIFEKFPNVGLVGTNTRLIDIDNKVLKESTLNYKNDKIWSKTEFIKHYLFHGNVFPCPTLMFRNAFLQEKIKSFNLECGPMADLYLIFQFNLSNKDLYLIKEPLYKYRIHKSQDSEINRINMEFQVQPFIHKLLLDHKLKDLAKKYIKSSNSQIISLLLFYFLSKKIKHNDFLNKWNKIDKKINVYTFYWSIIGILRGVKKICNDFIS